MSRIYIPILDASADISTVGIYAPAAAADLDITAFFDAVDGVSLGTLVRSYLVQSVQKDVGSTTPPVNQFARRESRWVCKYTDDVTLKEYEFSIPCADLALATGDVLNITAGAGLALKNAFEGVAESELGNAVTLNSVIFKGATY